MLICDEVAARQPADDVALRDDHPPQRRHVALLFENLAHELRPGVLEDFLLELVETILQLLDLGTVVIDHRIDDPVEEGDGAFAEDLGVSRAVVAQLHESNATFRRAR